MVEAVSQTSVGSPWSRRAVPAVLAMVLVALMIAERLSFLARAAPTDFDDAYTYLRYAQHWLGGDGIAWNAGERATYGVTSLLHLAVVTVIRWAFPTMAMWRVLQVASGAAAVGLLAALVATPALEARSRHLSRNWVFWAGVLLPLLAYREAFGFHAGTGMDTMLSALGNAVLVFFSLRLGKKPDTLRMLLTVAAAMIAVLARPDNLICALLCPALAIAFLGTGPRRKALARYLAMAGLGFALLAALAWLILGTPVPLSFFVKQPGYYGGFAGEFGWNPFRFLEVFSLSAWPFLVVTILLCDRRSWRLCLVLLVPALSTVAVLFRFNQIMGHMGRFYYPMLPFFVVAAALQLDRFVREPGPRPRRLLVRAVVALAIVLAARFGLRLGAERFDARGEAQALGSVGGYHVRAAAPLPEIDSWESARRVAAIARSAPTGASFAMSEHGLPGALAPQVSIIDVLGLHDAVIAFDGFSTAELFRRKPDFIWMPHPDHVAMLRDIIASDELWAHYDFYPDAFYYGVALRTDGQHAGELSTLLSSVWRDAYPGCAQWDYRAVRGE